MSTLAGSTVISTEYATPIDLLLRAGEWSQGALKRPALKKRRILEAMVDTSVYRTELGKVFRISEHDDGGLSVELLDLTHWVPGPIGMAGLRIAPTTTRLTARQILALPQ